MSRRHLVNIQQTLTVRGKHWGGNLWSLPAAFAPHTVTLQRTSSRRRGMRSSNEAKFTPRLCSLAMLSNCNRHGVAPRVVFEEKHPLHDRGNNTRYQSRPGLLHPERGHCGRLIRSEGSHVLQPLPCSSSSAGASGNNEIPCYQQGTINPQSSRSVEE